MKRLVVVESPTKARTIRNYLPKEYQVEASMGHVRDLPASASQIPARYKDKDWARLGVDVEDSFEPLYIVPPKKRDVVKSLKAALKQADELYIATDEDREGESIGWHLVKVLDPKVPVRRMVFHEITRDAILEALDRTREIDYNLVDAQETRRVLDRLVGYTLSPLLWKKIAPKLSAGRVQSVAMRLLVLREQERMAFVPASYWDLKADLVKDRQHFDAVMTHLDGVRLASGRDFDDQTGRLKDGLKAGQDVLLLSEEQARTLAEDLPGQPWAVSEVQSKIVTRSPAPPFITSTLQQEASRKLSLTARRTMQVAQSLYENGHITYMRTDSTSLSKEAVKAARASVARRYGDDYLSAKPRSYANKVKNAQEAHEAIRPAGKQMRTADEIGLTGLEARVYDLIWKRTIACQMAEARLRMTTVRIEVPSTAGNVATFRASGRQVVFPGFFRAYVEGSDDPEAAIEDRDQPLPDLAEGEGVGCHALEPVGHETKPPARYTEASLVKVLEKEGIGRPSTYASIIDTVIGRGYVQKNGSQLVPTFTAFAVNNLLEARFDQLVDVGFTANMEQILDDIASGEKKARPYLERFYQGQTGLQAKVEGALDGVDARQVSTIESPKWNGYVVRVGKYGPYVEGALDGETVTASLPEEALPGEVTVDDLATYLKRGNKDDEVLGIHPKHDLPVLLRTGRYGPYVQLGDDDDGSKKPPRTSLPPGVAPEDVDLPMAVQLVDLPRVLGQHPESGEPIKVNIGRYGPYAQHQRTFASLKKGDDLFTITLERALALIAEKTSKSKALRTIGKHPETGDPVEVWDGRYGPYVKHRKTNATLPKDRAPEAITMDEALALIAQREASKGTKRKGRRKKK
ncbi:MAG: type I DNA topoisomerase [Bacteroidota bacterium]